jgi:GT2 family glycosyltransferase
VRETVRSAPDIPDLRPVRLLEIEISEPLADVAARASSTGRPYERALALVRLHSFPLGMAKLTLTNGGLGAAQCADAIWQALQPEILAHLHGDGLPAVSGLPPDGIRVQGMPRCLQERADALAEAPVATVVLSTHERPESLASCLHSAARLDYPRFEIIVVDNAPRTEAAAEVVRQMRTEIPRLRYVREDRLGLAWARNCGLRLAEGEIVAFTDDDVELDPHWLSELVRGFSAGPRVACVTGLILPRELETPAQNLLEQFGGYSKGFAARLFDSSGHRPPADPLFPYAAGRLGSGGNMAFRRALLCEMGGFDPALGAGTPACSGEELIVFVSLINSGYQIAYEPGALIYHSHHRDYCNLSKVIYGYAVGVTAYLTKYVVEDPAGVLQIARRLPAGLRYHLDPRSHKNRNRQAGYPGELARLELKGMLYGPLAYLRSRRASRRLLRPGDLTGSRFGAGQ